AATLWFVWLWSPQPDGAARSRRPDVHHRRRHGADSENAGCGEHPRDEAPSDTTRLSREVTPVAKQGGDKEMKRRDFIKAMSCIGAGSMAPLVDVRASEPIYPASPVRLVAPFPPGGTVDILARLVSAQLSREISQSIIVENRAGAGGTIGADAVARAK